MAFASRPLGLVIYVRCVHAHASYNFVPVIVTYTVRLYSRESRTSYNYALPRTQDSANVTRKAVQSVHSASSRVHKHNCCVRSPSNSKRLFCSVLEFQFGPVPTSPTPQSVISPVYLSSAPPQTPHPLAALAPTVTLLPEADTRSTRTPVRVSTAVKPYICLPLYISQLAHQTPPPCRSAGIGAHRCRRQASCSALRYGCTRSMALPPRKSLACHPQGAHHNNASQRRPTHLPPGCHRAHSS